MVLPTGHDDRPIARISIVGVVVRHSETNYGVNDLAVLVGTETSRIRAALTIPALSRQPEAFIETILPSLRRCARTIGRAAGIDVSDHNDENMGSSVSGDGMR
jgi:DNA-binding IclR family transcriptional regulator